MSEKKEQEGHGNWKPVAKEIESLLNPAKNQPKTQSEKEMDIMGKTIVGKSNAFRMPKNPNRPK